jgi:hypothetical protein
MTNIKFNYLYRDAGNYKKWASIVFSNPQRLELKSLTSSFGKAFPEENLFIAHQIRVPEVFFYVRGNATSDDHCFHEFYTVEETSEPSNDQHSRTIGDFIAETRSQAKRGWIAFDPHELLPYGVRERFK